MTNTRVRNTHATTTVIAAVAMVAALVSGCGAVSSMMNDGVSNPITPEQSKAQVMDAAKEIVGILNLQVIEPAFFWHASCNDQGEAPFRSEMRIPYPLAASFDASAAEVAQMVKRLQTLGWTTDSDLHSHGATLTKNGVVVTLGPQAVGDSTRSLELLGECRDTTTTKDTVGSVEDVNLSAP
jgi:hypothetical protein